MNTDTAFRRSQVYRFLADAFLYPTENWLEDLPLLADILREQSFEVWDLDFGVWSLDFGVWSLELPALQAEHCRAFGLTGSLCYETEFGLPHEFRQSQELADLAGFYRAFGFGMGGPVRERPDHLGVALEFMHVLALKEARAAQSGIAEHVEVCEDARRKFLEDHLGKWIGLFAEALALNAQDGPYVPLARFAAAFVEADSAQLGLRLERPPLASLRPTPLAPDLSCETCPVFEEGGNP